ncbi:MAG: flagellin [Syntrophales bacterium]
MSISLTSTMSSNLNSLQATQQLMNQTEYRLTTGKKVNSALDDPIAYFKSEEHLQRAGDLQARKDGMSEAIETLNAGDEGITAIEELIASAKSLAQSALKADDDTEMGDYISQYNEILNQIDDLAEDSGYGGINLLGGTTQTLEVVFDEEGDSKITLTGFDASCASTGLNLSDATAAAWYSGTGATFDVTESGVNAMITALDDAKDTLRTKAKTMSNQLTMITARQDFTTNLITTLKEGSASLVNADTNEESVNLTALQTQQQLAINSLSIANSASQAVLSLFQ